MEHESIDKTLRHETNPYISKVLEHLKDKNVTISTHKIANKEKGIVEFGTGEITPLYTVVHAKNKVDVQQYNKVYMSGLTALFGLNKTEQKVLRYIFSKLEKDKDWIYFSIKECKEQCEYSSNQIVHTAIAGLIKKEIVARTIESFKLWINPTVMFNGDRMMVINEYIKSNDIVNKIDKQ